MRIARGGRIAARPLSPLYNMGASTYLRPLWFGIDTLEVSYSGAVSAEWRDALDALKATARASGEPCPVVLDGRGYGVQRVGLKPWAWVLHGSDVHLRLGTSMPGAGVRCLSLGLAASGAVSVLERAERALSVVGSFGAPRVSRIDVACDFQGWVPTLKAMRNVVCPATFRPVYPSIEHPETFQYGRGDVVVRVYNKTAEIKKGSHWPGVWQSVTGYDPSADVWRVEVQLRSRVLRELGIKNVIDALSSVDALFRFGLEWCSLRSSGRDSNVRRHPVHRAWSSLLGLCPSAPLERVRDHAAHSGAVALVPQVSGLLVTMGAHLGLREPDDVMAWVLRAMGEYHAERRACQFSDLVGRRQVELYGFSAPDGVSPSWSCGL